MLVVVYFKTNCMNKLLILIIVGFAISCKPNEHNNEADNQKMDSLISLVSSLNSKVAKMDSALQTKNAAKSLVVKLVDSSKISHIDTIPKIEKTKPKFKPVEVTKPLNDTVIYYFRDRRISVKVLPELNGRQQIIVYAPNGDAVYETETVRLSYQVSNQLKFRNDGSLELIKSSMNPGASLYWYESVTAFDVDNEPLYMHSFRHPYESVTDAMGEKYLWSKTERKWVKQELVIETNMPK